MCFTAVSKTDWVSRDLDKLQIIAESPTACSPFTQACCHYVSLLIDLLFAGSLFSLLITESNCFCLEHVEGVCRSSSRTCVMPRNKQLSPPANPQPPLCLCKSRDGACPQGGQSLSPSWGTSPSLLLLSHGRSLSPAKGEICSMAYIHCRRMRQAAYSLDGRVCIQISGRSWLSREDIHALLGAATPQCVAVSQK